MSEISVEGVRLTSSDKILYPEQGITKGELAEYYVAVAERILPHVANRPITMVRCPTGQEKKCFYQRHAGSGVPEQLHAVKVPGFDDPYLYVKDVSGLIAMVQMGVLEMHPWGVTVEHPDRPDRIIFDLDPDEGLGFGEVVSAAIEVRDRLARLDLRSFVKTTGGKGLHVVVPIDPVTDWRDAKTFAKELSGQMAADAPERYLTHLQGRAGRPDIHRLFAQRPDLDCRGSLFHPLKAGCARGHAAVVGRCRSQARPRRLHIADGAEKDRWPVRRFMGRNGLYPPDFAFVLGGPSNLLTSLGRGIDKAAPGFLGRVRSKGSGQAVRAVDIHFPFFGGDVARLLMGCDIAHHVPFLSRNR